MERGVRPEAVVGVQRLMYVCVPVWMHVCTYVRVFVCSYVRLNRRVYRDDDEGRVPAGARRSTADHVAWLGGN